MSLARNMPARIVEFEPIPAAFRPRRPAPFRMDLSELLPATEITDIVARGRLAFHCVGDTGGVKRPEAQHLVAQGMEQSTEHPTTTPVSFCYHLGDVVYYNGEIQDYWDQFYEPYEHYPLKIVGIPGNHDGELMTRQSTSLKGFYETFVAASPGTYTHESRDSGRAAINQPYFYWTLVTPLATIVGLYTNVPEFGRLDDAQRQWFVEEMKAADQTKPLVVALHHPVYSFDRNHSGSATMALELENAINQSRRVPNMVLSAHVHNYQRIELVVSGRKIPFLVIGNSGYWNLHYLAAAIGYQDPETEAKLIAAVDGRHGFMTFEFGHKAINGNFTTVPRPQESWSDPNAYNKTFDVFSYPSAPIFLAANETISLAPHAGTHLPAHDSAGGKNPHAAPRQHRQQK